jgi:hypothetical protein
VTADQAERVILEAEDQVTPVVDRANAGLDSVEGRKSESVHDRLIRITDQTVLRRPLGRRRGAEETREFRIFGLP